MQLLQVQCFRTKEQSMLLGVAGHCMGSSSVRFPVVTGSGPKNQQHSGHPTADAVSILGSSNIFQGQHCLSVHRLLGGGSLPVTSCTYEWVNAVRIAKRKGTKREKDHLLKILAVPCCGGGIPFWQRSWSWLPCSSGLTRIVVADPKMT